METPEAFDRLLRERSAALLRTAYLLTGDRHLAEDLLQSALTKTYLRWETLRDEAAAEAYVRKVMVSIYTRWWQRKWNGERPTAELPDVELLDPYGAADDREHVRRLLAQLPRRQRAVIVLRFYEDMSEKEIAESLGISPGTVKSTASAAMGKLRALLAEPADGVGAAVDLTQVEGRGGRGAGPVGGGERA
ncbi:RNA polymerase sigma-70 factor (sigma-E family) [Motilibacter rhizosphaerae]|uniref:RNA polymerase sigma-70 factor (Sigma-E family) n=1 Tax=Motilibacter rhizosphaerae TaxID=598652 RepID=A0A4V2F2Q7_9ACTN|nr:SigE family RNA polymerase sigma factor [Motilibacter rhizosphaerae]RZS78988.1 RNA polymerase sigma-70 factor (sigma-E family) [Motilibacter rhizosphaerae]